MKVVPKLFVLTEKTKEILNILSLDGQECISTWSRVSSQISSFTITPFKEGGSFLGK